MSKKSVKVKPQKDLIEYFNPVTKEIRKELPGKKFRCLKTNTKFFPMDEYQKAAK